MVGPFAAAGANIVSIQFVDGSVSSH